MKKLKLNDKVKINSDLTSQLWDGFERSCVGKTGVIKRIRVLRIIDVIIDGKKYTLSDQDVEKAPNQ